MTIHTISAILTIIWITAPAEAQDNTSDPYRDGWKRYVAQFNHASGAFKSAATIRQGREVSTQTGDVSFAFSNSGKRVDLEIRGSDFATPIRRLLCANSKYVFQLDRPEDRWVLSKMAMMGDESAKQILAELTACLSAIDTLAAFDGDPLADLAAALKPAPRAAGQPIVLTLTKEHRTVVGKNSRLYKSLLVELDDGPFFTLKQGTADLVTNKTAGSVVVTNEFRTVAGLPIPIRSLKRQTYPSSKGDLEIIDELTFEIDPSVIPKDKDFTLSAFGLPEPIGVEWRRPTPNWVWLLIAAGACAVLAFGFRFLARRLRRSSA